MISPSGVRLRRIGNSLTTEHQTVPPAHNGGQMLVKNRHTLVGVQPPATYVADIQAVELTELHTGYSTLSTIEVPPAGGRRTTADLLTLARFESYSWISSQPTEILLELEPGTDPVHALFAVPLGHALVTAERMAEADIDRVAVIGFDPFAVLLTKVLVAIHGIEVTAVGGGGCVSRALAEECGVSQVVACEADVLNSSRWSADQIVNLASAGNEAVGHSPAQRPARWRVQRRPGQDAELFERSLGLLTDGQIEVDHLVVDHLHPESIIDLDSPYWSNSTGRMLIYDW